MATKRSISFFTFNVKVLPTVLENTRRYENLVETWFKNGYRITHKGDNSHYFTLTTLDSYEFENNKVYYGVISKFVIIDDLDFINRETGQLVEFELPENLEARRQQYEFIFSAKHHRLAFIKAGKIDLEIKKKGAPLKQVISIVETAFSAQLDSGYSTFVELEQDSQVFEDIFNNKLLTLRVRVTYTNDDGLKEEHKRLVDGLMKDGGITEFSSRLKPSKNGEIKSEATLPNGLISLARENGEVNARVQYDDGHQKNINTVNHPEVTDVELDLESASKNNFIQNIFGIFLRKYN